jgi:biopolymer transport protein ExbD
MQSVTVLKNQILPSPLSQQAVIRPKGSQTKRVLTSSLMLTSLVDAFSILVIFLLMSAQHGIEAMELKKANRLPMAAHVDSISKGVVIRIEDGAYLLDEQPVDPGQLGTRLFEAKKRAAEEGDKSDINLIVQADRKMDFEELSPILRAGAEAGIHQFKFAVLEKNQGD